MDSLFGINCWTLTILQLWMAAFRVSDKEEWMRIIENWPIFSVLFNMYTVAWPGENDICSPRADFQSNIINILTIIGHAKNHKYESYDCNTNHYSSWLRKISYQYSETTRLKDKRLTSLQCVFLLLKAIQPNWDSLHCCTSYINVLHLWNTKPLWKALGRCFTIPGTFVMMSCKRLRCIPIEKKFLYFPWRLLSPWHVCTGSISCMHTV